MCVLLLFDAILWENKKWYATYREGCEIVGIPHTTIHSNFNAESLEVWNNSCKTSVILFLKVWHWRATLMSFVWYIIRNVLTHTLFHILQLTLSDFEHHLGYRSESSSIIFSSSQTLQANLRILCQKSCHELYHFHSFSQLPLPSSFRPVHRMIQACWLCWLLSRNISLLPNLHTNRSLNHHYEWSTTMKLLLGAHKNFGRDHAVFVYQQGREAQSLNITVYVTDILK